MYSSASAVGQWAVVVSEQHPVFGASRKKRFGKESQCALGHINFLWPATNDSGGDIQELVLKTVVAAFRASFIPRFTPDIGGSSADNE
jgi:hypothetical protein